MNGPKHRSRNTTLRPGYERECTQTHARASCSKRPAGLARSSPSPMTTCIAVTMLGDDTARDMASARLRLKGPPQRVGPAVLFDQVTGRPDPVMTIQASTKLSDGGRFRRRATVVALWTSQAGMATSGPSQGRIRVKYRLPWPFAGITWVLRQDVRRLRAPEAKGFFHPACGERSPRTATTSYLHAQQ